MKISKQVIFDAVTAVADYSQMIANETTLKIGFSGTATSFTAKVYGSMDGVNYTQITIIKDSTLSTATDITTKELFTADVTGYHKFKISVTAIAGGNITGEISLNY